MAEQERKETRRQKTGEEAAQGTEASSTGDELAEKIDDLLEEIDSVLEENAEEFVRNYVQKGGE